MFDTGVMFRGRDRKSGVGLSEANALRASATVVLDAAHDQWPHIIDVCCRYLGTGATGQPKDEHGGRGGIVGDPGPDYSRGEFRPTLEP